MNLNIKQVEALFKLNPQITIIRGNIAYDANELQVSYDLNAINSKVTSDEQAIESVKASAQAKLSALGLTTDEVKAILGTA